MACWSFILLQALKLENFKCLFILGSFGSMSRYTYPFLQTFSGPTILLTSNTLTFITDPKIHLTVYYSVSNDRFSNWLSMKYDLFSNIQSILHLTLIPCIAHCSYFAEFLLLRTKTDLQCLLGFLVIKDHFEGTSSPVFECHCKFSSIVSILLLFERSGPRVEERNLSWIVHLTFRNLGYLVIGCGSD